MARPIRIEYPDAVYHVFNLGLKRQRIFPSEKYCETFLESLADTCARLNVVVYAYSLLQDQYHLVIRTPEANLSRFMRQIDGLYTQQYQRLRGTNGPVFRGRYKAVLVQREKYLLPLTRYIHSKVELKDLKNPKYCSYSLYTGRIRVPRWFDRDEALKQLNVTAAARVSAYIKYVRAGLDPELMRFYGKKNLSSVMGDAKFKKLVARKRNGGTSGSSRITNASWRPSCRQIIAAVAKQFRVTESSIYSASRGPGSKNVPRWIAMYLCQELSAVTLQEIAKLFKLKRYGTVSTTVGKLKQEFLQDRDVREATQRLTARLSLGK